MSGIGNQVQLEVYHPESADELPISFEDWEAKARKKLDSGPFHYVADGAGGGETMNANRAGFGRWRIVPRMLNNVDHRETSVTLYGNKYDSPFLLAPVGVQSIVHPEGELASAKAAAAMGVPYITSTAASNPMEKIAAVMGDAPRWFQLYWGKDPEVTASMLHRAEEAGYTAIVVTLDTSMLSWREKDLENAYLPFLQGEGIANYISDSAFCSKLKKAPEEDMAAAIQYFIHIFSNASLTWENLKFLREHTKLPILLKGILHPEDAQLALEHGADGIIVSNHGGRQVDGAIAAVDALPKITEAVDGRVPVLMDSGIRRGTDVVKALALGASAVLIGRPYMYGLAVAGEAGVKQIIRNLLADFDLTMALSGKKSVNEIERSLLEKE